MRHTTCIAAIVLTVAACGAGASVDDAEDTPPAPRQVIVAVDLSGSQGEDRRASARQTVEMIISELGWGDRLVLLQVHQNAAGEAGAARWTETVPLPASGRPTSLDRERLEAVREAARSVAQTMFARDSAGHLPTTDLIATLHIAAEYIRDNGSRPTTLVLLSDMFQSAHGIEMAQPNGMPGADWIEQQRSAGILPHLDGACVAVIGADATTAHGVAVRNFWTRYLAAAGASLNESNYRLIATDGAALGCR